MSFGVIGAGSEKEFSGEKEGIMARGKMVVMEVGGNGGRRTQG